MAIDLNKKATKKLTDVLIDRTGETKEKTQQISLYLPVSKHRKLKMESVRTGKPMTKIIEEWIDIEIKN
ncbi:hypothetical protein [Bifidobacterium crudilactis]|jgi:hypothetical protein|uniref:hypothetical protein n=1 Tax=Bifidobacterium crudilactis TaxID=327277 RepID=UPI000552120F|nr:hypothetical protein [Bifidobacterium crudilactis]MDN5973503.1 hypothetical protein [Bifidobacterium crudilactis]MDN6001765.1 hypothetical protein [Bifidobacterium crudilactis]MDN6468203.1 hypothetical protein [Bifidobacterium crudilactis]MDN6559592.1 hypothetical protein [Bifidobacterium crudilactis]MDN6773432.1 hypothetical protein [Bifidobacterium crudilactis]